VTPTVLVLGAADGAVPTYRAARRLGLRTIAVDVRPDAPAVRLADEHVHVSTTDVAAIADAVAGRREIVAVVAPASDVALPVQLALAHHLGLPTGLSELAVGASTDKARFRRIVSQAGLSGPRYVSGDPAAVLRTADRLRYPLVVKPVDATGSRGVVVCGDHSALGAAVNRAAGSSRSGRLVAEERLRGRHCTVEALVDEGRVVFAAASERVLTVEPFGITREHRMGRLAGPVRDRIVQALDRLCTALDYRWGPLDVDLVLDRAGTPQLVEAGARVGGNGIGELALAAYGVDVTELALRMALGERVRVPEGTHRHAHLRMVTADTDGVVTGVRSVEVVRSLPGIRSLQLTVRKGDAVRPYVEAAAKLGYVIAAADTAERAASALDEAFRRLRVDVATGGSLNSRRTA
jgi:biotin carboxylase